MSRRLISPVLVGRDTELRDAIGNLRRAAAGRPSVIVLAGEAGIGKTRLADAIAARAAKDGFRVLAGSCVPVSVGTLTYGPVTQALRALALTMEPDALATLVGDDAALLARIVPALGGTAVPDVPDPPSSGASRTRLFEALFNLVRRLAASSPVLLVVDDLQWADPESLDVLAYLAHSVRDERMTLLLTVRTEEVAGHAGLAGWLAELERLVLVDPMELRRLDRDETDRLVRAILGWRPGAAVLDEIHARSDGNPFFVEELLQPGRDHTLATSMAPSLRAILEDRVRVVAPGTWRVLTLLAVARRDLDDGLLAGIAALPEADLAVALNDASERGLLTVERNGAGDRYRLRHALIGEAVGDRLFAAERRRLHGELALGLEQATLVRGAANGTAPWAEIAGHWDAAGDVDRALPAWCRAGDEAEHAFAFRAALDSYGRALAAWDSVVDPERAAGRSRLALLDRAGWAAFLAAAPGGDVPLRRLAVAEADRLGDPVASAVARADLGFSLWAAGEPAGAEAAYREAAAMVPAEPPSVARAHVLSVLGQVLMNTGRHRQALALCDEAIAIGRALGERRQEANATDTRGVALAYLGRSREAVEALDGARSIAIELGDVEEVGRAFLNESEILVLGGQPSRALALAREGIETCSAMGTWLSFGQYICLHGAVAAYELGDWATAGQLAEEGHVVSEAANDELYYLAHIVELAVGRGDWEAADRHLLRMAQLIPIYPAELQYTGPHATAGSELALWRHDPEGAIRVIGEALDRLERTDDLLYRIRLLRIGMRAAADLAEVARARREPDTERHAVDTAVGLRARVAGAVDGVSGMDGGARHVAEADLLGVAAESGRLHAAPQPGAWRAVAGAWADLERPALVGYARWREAEAWLQDGSRPEALTALREAAAIADRLGAVPLAREVAGLARRARLAVGGGFATAAAASRSASPPRPVRHPAFDLTPRELDVLALLRDGRTDRQIAEALFISPHTVGIHVSRILGKLGAHGRTEAAAIAYRLGIAGAGDRPPE